MDAQITEYVAVPTTQGCVWVFAYSEGWPRPFMGALFFTTAEGRIIEHLPGYASPAQLTPAGNGRLVFEYVEGEGAGTIITHVAVLCSFGTQRWAECAQFPLESRIGSIDGLQVDRYGTFEVQGSQLTIVYTGNWALLRSGVEERAGTLAPDTIRVRLP